MISAAELQTKLEGYPEEVIQCYTGFLEDHNPDKLTQFIVGIIRFMQDAGDSQDTDALSDKTNLQADLSVDSITIAEVVFLMEDIFEIEIDNQDVIELTTIGKIREYILERLKS